MPNESTGANVIKFLGMTEIPIVYPFQKADTIGENQIIIRPGEQGIAFLLFERPGDRIRDLQIERNPQFGIEVALDIEFSTVGDRKVELTTSHFFEQVDDFNVCVLGPIELRISHAQ